jgi:uncharacterized protein DUF6011
MGRYRWVYGTDGVRYYDVGILEDGTLHNPNGYPEEIVLAQVMAADARRHERRSKAAKKAAITRAERKEKRTQQIARHIINGMGVKAQKHCAICGRHLDDTESIARGIGSECWQFVLRAASASKDAA